MSFPMLPSGFSIGTHTTRAWKKKTLLVYETTRKAQVVDSTSSKSSEIKLLCSKNVVTLFLRKRGVFFWDRALFLEKKIKKCASLGVR